ncbi:MAG: tRNA pseudouridine(55) synthase TruB [Nitrospirae bacterium]|nr:tRNA pseudouridine(55) synthase TruB [Nitrospirota bacterium]
MDISSPMTPYHGVLVLWKEPGATSHDLVQEARRLLRQRKVGHLGTLDPQAAGVLPLCLGRATRLTPYLMEGDKEYRVTLRLGEQTDTQDAWGKVLASRPWDPVTETAIRAVCRRFVGRIIQQVPLYSAVKVGGRPLYRYARSGRPVASPSREITISHLKVVEVALPLVTLEVQCGKGTYMRTLCHDLGEALGVGGHLAALSRLRSGPFTRREAVTLDELKARVAEGRIREVLLPLETLLPEIPILRVTEAGARKVAHGQPLGLADLSVAPDPPGEALPVIRYRVFGEDGRLLAIAKPLIFQGKPQRSGEGGAAFLLERVLA